MEPVKIELTEKEAYRFYTHVDFLSKSPCWIWKGRNSLGYGRFNLGKRPNRKSGLAHRISFVASEGGLVDKLLHHICENRLCVNPTHLEPTTREAHASLHHHGMPKGLNGRLGSRKGGLLKRKNNLPEGVAKNGFKFIAQKCHDNKPHYLGSFYTVEEARRVYVEYCKKHRLIYN